MSNQYICINRIRFDSYIKEHHKSIYDNMVESKLVQLPSNNFLVELDTQGLLYSRDLKVLEQDSCMIPVCIKLIPIYSDGVYLLDTAINSSRDDMVKLPGCYIESSAIYEQQIISQVIKSLYIDIYRSGEEYWNSSNCQYDICEASEQCDFPIIKTSPVWYCHYHIDGCFTMYIPCDAAYVNSNLSVEVTPYDIMTFRQISKLSPQSIIEVKDSMLMAMDLDERVDKFDEIIEPVFNSLDELRDVLREFN